MLLDAVIILLLALLPKPPHYYIDFPQFLLLHPWVSASSSPALWLEGPSQPLLPWHKPPGSPQRWELKVVACESCTSNFSPRWFESLPSTGTTYEVESLSPRRGAETREPACPLFHLIYLSHLSFLVQRRTLGQLACFSLLNPFPFPAQKKKRFLWNLPSTTFTTFLFLSWLGNHRKTWLSFLLQRTLILLAC